MKLLNIKKKKIQNDAVEALFNGNWRLTSWKRTWNSVRKRSVIDSVRHSRSTKIYQQSSQFLKLSKIKNGGSSSNSISNPISNSRLTITIPFSLRSLSFRNHMFAFTQRRQPHSVRIAPNQAQDLSIRYFTIFPFP